MISGRRGAVIVRYAGRLENPIMIDGRSVSKENDQGLLLHSGQSS